MSTFSCLECGENHSLEFNRWITKAYTIELEGVKNIMNDRNFMRSKRVDPVFPDYIIPLMNSKSDADLEKICRKFEKMAQGFRCFDGSLRDIWMQMMEERNQLLYGDFMLPTSCEKTRFWKAEIMRGEFYIYKMIKLGKPICTKELCQLMKFEIFDILTMPSLLFDLKDIYEMHQYLTICNHKPENQWVELTKLVKVNLKLISFPGNGTLMFPVQVDEATKSGPNDPLNFHLKCCINDCDKIVPIIEFDQNPLAGILGEDWRPLGHDKYKMIFLARQVEENDKVTTGKNAVSETNLIKLFRDTREEPS